MRSSWANASIQNIRTQRQFDLEVLDIERRCLIELKTINRKRLGIIFDLNRFRSFRRNAEHTSDSLCGQDLRLYTRKCQDRMFEQRLSHRRARKFEFDIDDIDRRNLNLPAISVDTNSDKQGVKEHVTSLDLNLKRASMQKSSEDLVHFLNRNVRRRTRRQSEIEEDLLDFEDESDTATEGELSSRSLTLPVPSDAMSRKGSTTPRSFLPPIQEDK